jgi:hypothetical protein
MGDRGRGVLLYACSALLLAGGGVWWFRAAPHERVDPQIQAWRTSAEKMLPDAENQADADTIALTAGEDHEVVANVGNGSYQVSVICVGAEGSMVRISLGEVGDDSGRGLDCAGDHTPYSFPVGIAGQLRANVSVGATGPVIFRYSLVPVGD